MSSEQQASVQITPAPRPRPFPVLGPPPGHRCGHTLTAITGPNGDLSGARLVLFGGATALEGNAGREGGMTASSPADGSATGIRLAGATNDVHLFDVKMGRWEKIEPGGEPPSPRAAHAAAAVGNMVVIQGGIGPTGLASEDLHVLDFTDPNKPKWHRVFVQGPGPSARYAHTLALVANRFLVALGGNDGKQTLSDSWALDTSEKPYQWRKIPENGPHQPEPRMYATAAARSDGLLLLCGGRGVNGQPLGDAYGLARHRDGRWEWANAPGVMPTARYQHSAVFVGARLHVSGGSIGGGKMVDDGQSVVVLDTSAGGWGMSAPPPTREEHELCRRCRHAVAAVGPFVFIYGGLRHSELLDDLLLADESDGSEQQIRDIRSEAWSRWDDTNRASDANDLLKAAAAEEAAVAAAIQQTYSDSGDLPPDQTDSASVTPFPNSVTDNSGSPFSTEHTPDVRLYHRAVVVAQESAGSLRGLVRQLSIDQFENENRRISTGRPGATVGQSPIEREPPTDSSVHKKVIGELLKPRRRRLPESRAFILSAQEVTELCDVVQQIFENEKTVLQLKAPVKIFGDLHGQFGDLMRLFDEYGSPSTGGDITYIDYLFLGDYVDRGTHSLETICLLLSLKKEHPNSVHLIRGNHEAADINALFGFRMECMERLGDPDGKIVWNRINQLFNYLPLAALIENKIMCMHGGIGRSIQQISQIEKLKRPLTMEEGGMVLMDLLWSDPTVNDQVTGVQPSPRGPGLVTFGPDRVMEFTQNNNLQMIIRAHECVMDGFERFAQGRLITLFSATNYCGTANNAGAILVVGRDLVLVPKLIHPLPPNTATQEDGSIDEDRHLPDEWMENINQERPPTPPRGSGSQNGGLAYF
eukprot:TRINITY_DN4158_c0_g2_i2.p1 TRINITY_DN4158_c0_g2~~TRINITY_DN4158_c0_g2_i2.p1  ORF type:complete len:916 (+),score=170.18 TRINITY_DN4158_c0_g2_i2:140-2749(+)